MPTNVCNEQTLSVSFPHVMFGEKIRPFTFSGQVDRVMCTLAYECVHYKRQDVWHDVSL